MANLENNNQTANFLVEIGTEELPPKSLKKLSQAFAQGIESALLSAELSYLSVDIFASPRRLAVRVNDLQTRQIDKIVEKKGPAKKFAFDSDAKPTKALEGFARGCGVSIEQLQEIETPKGLWMVYYQKLKGQKTLDLLADIVDDSLTKLPIPKRMRWGDYDISFVRPVHWVLMLFGDNIVPANILGCKASNLSYGHRFHAPQTIKITTPQNYEHLLRKQGFVIANFTERLNNIKQQLDKIAQTNNTKVVVDDDLLEEVTALNEWPISIVGEFDHEFLEAPEEALISAMKGHQKYFHMVDNQGKLIPKFVSFSNIESKNLPAVIAGNERVIKARLSDAKFFWQQDCKHELQSFLPQLEHIIFQEKLGTLLDKTYRLEELSIFIADKMKLNPELNKMCHRAAKLSKCDLMTDVVAEFPDLQGVMGRYYASKSKEETAVAIALEEQYKPRFSSDNTPKTIVGQVLALADKLDTITGIYAIGQVPTGDKDPFALKRSALGIMRIMLENSIDLNLLEVIKFSLKLHKSIDKTFNLSSSIHDFMLERLRYYYLHKGTSAENFNAVKVCKPKTPLDFHKRIKALEKFLQLSESTNLIVANKRISNILRKSNLQTTTKIKTELLSEQAELNLYNKLLSVKNEVSTSITSSDYVGAITKMTAMKDQVDNFFEDVMVMVDDEAIKNNRLILLQMVQQMFSQVADISYL